MGLFVCGLAHQPLLWGRTLPEWAGVFNGVTLSRGMRLS